VNGLGYFLVFAEALEAISPGSLAVTDGDVFSTSPSSSCSNWLLFTTSVAFFSNLIILVGTVAELLPFPCVGVDAAGVVELPYNAAAFTVSVSK